MTVSYPLVGAGKIRRQRPCLQPCVSICLGQLPVCPTMLSGWRNEKNIISVYWKERGGVVELAKVIDFLTDCAAIPDSLEDGSSASDEAR